MASAPGNCVFTPANTLAKCQPAWEKHPCVQKAFCASQRSQLQVGATRSELQSPTQRAAHLA